MQVRLVAEKHSLVQIQAFTTPEWLAHIKRTEPETRVICDYGGNILIIPAGDLEAVYPTDYVPDSLPLG